MSALRRDGSFDYEAALAARARGERSALRRIYEPEAPVLQVRHTALPKNVITQQALDARLVDFYD
jgi:hypothetical protein